MSFQSKDEFLAALFKEMGRCGDFPAISESVWKIVAVMDREYEDFDLTQAILDDVALTQRVLREANSAMYARFGQNITTVTQAVVVLGYDRIGHLALGLKLTNALMGSLCKKDSRARKALHQSTITGTLARLVARKLCGLGAEEAGVCGLLYGVSRVLVMFYLPSLWDEVESLMVDSGVPEAEALQRVAHISRDELGVAVGQHWRLPERLVRVLGGGELEPQEAAPGHAQWLFSLVSNVEKLRCKLELEGYAPSGSVLQSIVTEYAGTLGLSRDELLHAVESTLREECDNPLVRSFARPPVPKSSSYAADEACQHLGAFHSVLKTDARKHSTRSLFGMTLEVMHRVFGARSVVLMLHDAASRRLTARVALGANASRLLGRLSIESDYAPDAFHLAIARNAPLFIADAVKLRGAGKLPASYGRVITDCPAFLLVPFIVLGVPEGLLYIDWEPGSHPSVGAQEQASLLAVRDLLVASLEERRAHV